MIVFAINAKEKRLAKWYFGGISSACAAILTHPLDLLKVQMQTQKGKNISAMTLTRSIVQKQGILGLYHGISASVVRQLTYSTSRFGIYVTAKQHFMRKDGAEISFFTLICLAGLGGMVGGFVGNPADLINVRMQNDIKLPLAQRRNYKNVLDGLYRVIATEGIRHLWTGGATNIVRAACMNIGQLSFYDQSKSLLLETSYFRDNVPTHVISSILAAATATTMAHPIDVIKTRVMNANPGQVHNVLTLVTATAKEGPLAFYKGFLPAFVRLAPHTALTFVFFEQLRMNFGLDISPQNRRGLGIVTK